MVDCDSNRAWLETPLISLKPFISILYKGQFLVCWTLLVGRISGLIARPRPPHGVLNARVVTAPAVGGRGRGRRKSFCTESRGGGGGSRVMGRRVEAGEYAVKHGETEAVC